MAGAETVILAFRPFGKPAQASVLPQGWELCLPSGEELVDIGLVSYIPDDFVPGHGKYLVQGHGQFHHPQIGSQMAAVFAGHCQDLLSDFPAEFRQLFIGYFFQV